MSGSVEERGRAKEYLDWLFEQLRGPVYVDNWEVHPPPAPRPRPRGARSHRSTRIAALASQSPHRSARSQRPHRSARSQRPLAAPARSARSQPSRPTLALATDSRRSAMM